MFNKSNIYLIFTYVFLLSAALYAGNSEVIIRVSSDKNNKESDKTEEITYDTLQKAINEAVKISDSKIERIVIAVKSGVYKKQKVVTSGNSNGIPIIIEPSYKEGKKPVFDGDGKVLQWFTLNNANGKPTRITIDGMEVKNYLTAISLNGNRECDTASNGDNIIKNCIFENIGQIANKKWKPSFAAIRLVNSYSNKIEGNRFIDIRNVTGCAGLHSIYIAHDSCNNIIEKNIFDGGCGPTIKVRDYSNFNIIKDNIFKNQNTYTIFLDAYCNRDKYKGCTKKSPECPSWGNIFEDNTIYLEGVAKNFKAVRILKGSGPKGCKKAPTDASVRIIKRNNLLIKNEKPDDGN